MTAYLSHDNLVWSGVSVPWMAQEELIVLVTQAPVGVSLNLEYVTRAMGLVSMLPHLTTTMLVGTYMEQGLNTTKTHRIYVTVIIMYEVRGLWTILIYYHHTYIIEWDGAWIQDIANSVTEVGESLGVQKKFWEAKVEW